MNVKEAKEQLFARIMVSHSLSIGEAWFHIERMEAAIRDGRLVREKCPPDVLDFADAVEAEDQK